jgi:hypothetical protein
MEPEVKQDTTTEKLTVNVNKEESGKLSTFSSSETSEQIKQIWDRVVEVISDLPDYISEFYGQYKRPITVIGLIVAAYVAVKLLFAVLGAINEIPLLSPLFELIGIFYTGWFVYRYLWQESSRKELGTSISSLKEQVLGSKSGNK